MMPSTVQANLSSRTAELLGGAKVLARPFESPLEAHDLLNDGLPGRSLIALYDQTHLTEPDWLQMAIGVSLRTLQRKKAAPEERLSLEQSGRAWKFAELLARATETLGGRAEAERWFENPAIGLDQRRPLDLLATPAGVSLVEDYLTRMEYGVYT